MALKRSSRMCMAFMFEGWFKLRTKSLLNALRLRCDALRLCCMALMLRANVYVICMFVSSCYFSWFPTLPLVVE